MITCIFIGGPTASGKTALSIQLAKYFQCDIISADSRQLYRELNIGVAKPPLEELNRTKHHLIDSHSIHSPIDASDFEQLALDLINQLTNSHNHVIITGGTGLYLNAILHGLDRFPSVDDGVLKELEIQFQNEGLVPLVKELEEKDFKYYGQVDLKNHRRVIRALSVIRQSGRPFSYFLGKPKKPRPFKSVGIQIQTPREILYHRINQRVDQMVKQGLVDEARPLLEFRQFKPLQTVGYAELFEYFDGKISLEVAVEEIKKNTRRYAKRQLTWLKKYFPFPEYELEPIEKIIESIQNQA